MKRTSSTLLAVLVMTISSTALAGGKKPHHGPSDGITGEQTQLQGQLQAQGQDQQQAAIAGAASSSAAGAASIAAGGDGGSAFGGAGGNSGGNTFSTAYESRDRALALALPGQTGAPAVAGECLEHLRGGSGASIGVSGRTRINRECMEFQQCVAIADRYAAWGQLQLAVEQLEQCGGVENAVIAAPPEVVESTNAAFISRDEFEERFERAWTDLQAK